MVDGGNKPEKGESSTANVVDDQTGVDDTIGTSISHPGRRPYTGPCISMYTHVYPCIPTYTSRFAGAGTLMVLRMCWLLTWASLSVHDDGRLVRPCRSASPMCGAATTRSTVLALWQAGQGSTHGVLRSAIVN